MAWHIAWGNSPKHNERVPAQLRHESTFPRSLQTAFMPTQSRGKTFFHMPIAFSNRHLFPVAKAARPCSANRLHARLGGEPREHPRLIGKSIVQLIHGTNSGTSHLLSHHSASPQGSGQPAGFRDALRFCKLPTAICNLPLRADQSKEIPLSIRNAPMSAITSNTLPQSTSNIKKNRKARPVGARRISAPAGTGRTARKPPRKPSLV